MDFCWLPNIYIQYMNASYRHLKERHLKKKISIKLRACVYVCVWCLLRTEEHVTSPDAEPTGSCKHRTWMLENELEGSLGAASGSDC